MAIINGTTSDDILIGTSANDIIDGGAGNDLLIGSGGWDTYIFGTGSNQDTLDLTTNYNDYGGMVIQMAGLAIADVTFSRAVNNPYDLVLTINGTNDSMTIKNFYWHTTHINFQFSDGLLDWQSEATRNLPELWEGTAGNDSINAWGEGPAIMNGNAGDDFLNGSQFDDVISGGDGNDDLSGGSVAIWGANGFMYNVSGNDTLDGGAGDDNLHGMEGNDTLIGGTGDDTYWFNLGDGQDTIQEYDYTIGNLDTIRFGPGITASDITFTRSGMDLILGIAGTTDQITIQKWGWGDAWRVERLVFTDGTIWDAAQILANVPLVDTITGTDGNDSLSVWPDESGTVLGLAGDDRLFGKNGNDTLIGGAGNDVLVGGLGNDTYVFNLGDGQDTIIEYGGDVDTIAFGTGIAASNIVFSRSGMNLVLGIAGTTDQITIQSWGSGYGYPIDRIEFADGTVWDQAQISAGIPTPGVITGTSGDDALVAWAGPGEILVGMEGNDSLFGNNGADTLIGGVGNDYLSGDNGNDTYVFNLGDGQDIIVETGGTLDTIMFGVGITASDLTLKMNGTDLVIGISGSTDQITIRNWQYGDSWLVERIEFADSTAWDSAQIAAAIGSGMPLAGTDGDDILIGTDGDDTIDGLGGNDTLIGLNGNDILNGGSGNDILDGGEGNNILDGGTGDDLLVRGQSSQNTYLLRQGDGNDTLINPMNGWGNQTIQFMDVMSTAPITLGVQGNDLTIHYGLTDSITIQGGMGPDAWSTQVMFADGISIPLGMLYSQYPIYLTEGDDTFAFGSDSSATVYAGAGNDFILSYGTSSDYIFGENGNDWIHAGAGDDLIDGGMGVDFMYGESGNDTYIVDNIYDAVFENSGEGIDTVKSSVTYTLSDNVENIELTGAAAINAKGNNLDNILDGSQNSAFNILEGGLGNDIYIVGHGDSAREGGNAGIDTVISSFSYSLAVNFENLQLSGMDSVNGTGNSLQNILTGNSGNNILNGGAGADTMLGGAGDDTYVVDDIGDIVVENYTEGMDTVQSSINYFLHYNDNIANLTLTGSNSIVGSGNELDNIITGNSASNILSGWEGNDILNGGGGNDSLNGGAGNDYLNGGSGSDNMIGGTGDDIYIVDNTSDAITENANEGNDTIYSSVTYTTKANVENLILTGTAAINGTDNTLNNLLAGNAANNTLTAGTGNDILQGGAGNDTLKDTSGSNLLDGGAGNDIITGNAGNEFFAGGAGIDTITTGNGADVIAFNRGDGQDIVNGGVGTDNTLSLGGGILYSDLALSKVGSDLILEVGSSEQITLKNWYSTTANYKSVLDLQMVADAMATFDPASTDPLLNKAIQNFDFTAIVNSFDQSGAPSHWSAMNSLLTFHLSASDTAALGGDLAHQYGRAGNFTGMNLAAAQTVLNDVQFGSTAQTLSPLQDLKGGTVTL